MTSTNGARGGMSAALALGTGLLVIAGAWLGQARADDAPPPPPLLSPAEALLLPLKEQLKASSLPSFIKDTDLKLHLRTYYFNRTMPDDTVNEAEAVGGSIGYNSGWLLDTFAWGATLYGSAPIYAPEDRDGTLLLKPDQKGYYVPGEAWGALRYKDYALLTGYRQLVDQTYINPQDSRMTPNTFEALTLGGKVGWVQYLGGYLWSVKTRNSDEFVAMSSSVGIRGKRDGVGLAGVRLTPVKDLRIDLSNQYGINMFNTIYAEGEYLHALSDDWTLGLGVQFTDQRAVGDALMAPAGGKYWATQAGGARVQAIFRDLTLLAAFSITGDGNTIQNPWGSFPGYLSMLDQDFDRADEKAWVVGAVYDFGKLVEGLRAKVALAWGVGAINPSARTNLPNQAEYDFTADYRPTLRGPASLEWIWKGMWFRARSAIIDQEDSKTLGYQFRLIINWDRDLI
jgi:hypothetical protein